MNTRKMHFKLTALAAVIAATAALLAGSVAPAHADLTGPKPPPQSSSR